MENKSGRENYISFVNRSYYVASLLIERLEELKIHHIKPELEALLDRAIFQLRAKAILMRDVIVASGETDSAEAVEPVLNLLESIFNRVLQPGLGLQHIHLYDYLNLSDCMMRETERINEILSHQLSPEFLTETELYDTNILNGPLDFLKENFQSAVIS
ncbi:hypothetical protein FPZ42_11475 [Mucilaginibacter achroorhodeus]|uniref:Uncharacterized protein n=1 Tax=Mucilaginibacter achroorhodeus TaxID=2599294 RepID=A0A563U4G5_9SPHI|nr:hypothetical protein [Mucilaginibacter achroorhodeus]TWR26238.1 hypothetical protein FPZ42_11475 [Mucilaginibacter achroorhodeus]